MYEFSARHRYDVWVQCKTSIWCMSSVQDIDMMYEFSARHRYDVWVQCKTSIWCMSSVQDIDMMYEFSARHRYDLWVQCKTSIWCMSSVQDIDMMYEFSARHRYDVWVQCKTSIWSMSSVQDIDMMYEFSARHRYDVWVHCKTSIWCMRSSSSHASVAPDKSLSNQSAYIIYQLAQVFGHICLLIMVNSLGLGRCERNFKRMIFKFIVQNRAWTMGKCFQVNAREPLWIEVNIGSSNGLVPSGNSHYLSQCWPTWSMLLYR